MAHFLRKKYESNSTFKHYIKNQDLYNGALNVENSEMNKNSILLL